MNRISIVLVLLCCGSASADRVIFEVENWRDAPGLDKRIASQPEWGPDPTVPQVWVKVDAEKLGPGPVTLFAADIPAKLTQRRYAIIARVKWIQGSGGVPQDRLDLEMLSYQHEGCPVVTKITKNPNHPYFGGLVGSSGSHIETIVLRSEFSETSMPPTRITLQAIMPKLVGPNSRAWFVVGPVWLVEFEPDDDWMSIDATNRQLLRAPRIIRPWWSVKTYEGDIFWIGLGTISLWTIGIGTLVLFGKSRILVLPMTFLELLAGLACVAGEVVAVMQEQPWFVGEPLFLGSGLMVVLSLAMFCVIRVRYRRLAIRRRELKRIEATDMS
jgi:hypothetical protein